MSIERERESRRYSNSIKTLTKDELFVGALSISCRDIGRTKKRASPLSEQFLIRSLKPLQQSGVEGKTKKRFNIKSRQIFFFQFPDQRRVDIF